MKRGSNIQRFVALGCGIRGTADAGCVSDRVSGRSSSGFLSTYLQEPYMEDEHRDDVVGWNRGFFSQCFDHSRKTSPLDIFEVRI